MVDDAATVAAGLSKPQRVALTHAWPYPDYHRTGEQVSYCPAIVNASGSAALDRRGLSASRANGGPRLTPLGLSVRDHILKEQG
jgi:hypothetical protein